MFLRRFAAKSAAISQSSVSAPAPMDVAPPNAFTESHLEEVQGMEIPVHGGLPPEFEAQPVVAAAASHQASKQSDLFEANRNTEFDPLPDPVMDF